MCIDTRSLHRHNTFSIQLTVCVLCKKKIKKDNKITKKIFEYFCVVLVLECFDIFFAVLLCCFVVFVCVSLQKRKTSLSILPFFLFICLLRTRFALCLAVFFFFYERE